MNYAEMTERLRLLAEKVVGLEGAAVSGRDGFAEYRAAVDGALAYIESADVSVSYEAGDFDSVTQFQAAVNGWVASALLTVAESVERVAGVLRSKGGA